MAMPMLYCGPTCVWAFTGLRASTVERRCKAIMNTASRVRSMQVSQLEDAFRSFGYDVFSPPPGVRDLLMGKWPGSTSARSLFPWGSSWFVLVLARQGQGVGHVITVSGDRYIDQYSGGWAPIWELRKYWRIVDAFQPIPRSEPSQIGSLSLAGSARRDPRGESMRQGI